MKNWFTSDTHYGSKRTLQLSKRPFETVNSMDSTMIDNHNRVVGVDDIVYHLGDVGEMSSLEYMNGKIFLLPGNYDEGLKRPNCVTPIESGHVLKINDDEYSLIHEPENADRSDKFYLFGHIHKLQMVKTNGLNVGVDCHNFLPISYSDVVFYREAITKYYDKNVFMPTLGS